MIENKRKVKVVSILLIMIMTLGLLSGCGVNKDEKKAETDSYEQPVKNMIEGLSEANADKFLKAFPEYISEQMKLVFTEDYLKETVKKAEEEYGANLKMSYKITDKADIAEEDLREMEEEVKESFGKEIKISKGYKLGVEVTTKGDDTEDKEVDEFKVYEVDGKWYMLAF